MSAFEFDNDYDPDERLQDKDDLFFDEECISDLDDLDNDLDDDDGYGYDPEEEIASMFPNDEYGDELEDYIINYGE